MLSLEKIRKEYPELADLSDGDLELLRAQLYETVQIAFELWTEERGPKNPLWLLSYFTHGHTI